MRLISIAFACLSLLACQKEGKALPYYDSADFTPRWDISTAPAVHSIRPFSLVDQKAATFTERDIEGKIAVVDFFFTSCPGICPALATSMGQLQKEFRDDDHVILLSHSVTPETDTPAVLARYAEAHHVEFDRWKLLTGSKSEIYDLGKRYYFVDEDQGQTPLEDKFLHTENFILLDGQRRIRGIYNGLNPDSVRSLIADIKLLSATEL